MGSFYEDFQAQFRPFSRMSLEARWVKLWLVLEKSLIKTQLSFYLFSETICATDLLFWDAVCTQHEDQQQHIVH
jgi:hypothetical protein